MPHNHTNQVCQEQGRQKPERLATAIHIVQLLYYNALQAALAKSEGAGQLFVGKSAHAFVR
jgi:hypothetical protein